MQSGQHSGGTHGVRASLERPLRSDRRNLSKVLEDPARWSSQSISVKEDPGDILLGMAYINAGQDLHHYERRTKDMSMARSNAEHDLHHQRRTKRFSCGRRVSWPRLSRTNTTFLLSAGPTVNRSDALASCPTLASCRFRLLQRKAASRPCRGSTYPRHK